MIYIPILVVLSLLFSSLILSLGFAFVVSGLALSLQRQLSLFFMLSWVWHNGYEAVEIDV